MAPDAPVGRISPTGGFSKNDRIRTRPRYLEVYARSAPIYTAWFVFYACPNGLEHPRLGITVTKRVAGSVERNRIKRIIREVFRIWRHQLPTDCDLIANAKRNASGITAGQAEKAFLQAARRLRREGYTPCAGSSSS